MGNFFKTLELKKVLISGYSGFIGQHVRQLGLDYGVDFYYLGRNKPELVADEKYIYYDFSDSCPNLSVIGAFSFDFFIHLAAPGVRYGSGNLENTIQFSTIGLVNILEVLKAQLKPPTLILIGSGFEYNSLERAHEEGDELWPNSIYSLGKLSTYQIAQYYSKNFNVHWLRPFSVYGVGEDESRFIPYVIKKSLLGESIDVTGCDQIRDYAYVDDVAEAIWRVCALPIRQKHFSVCNISSGIRISLKDFIKETIGILESKGCHPDILWGKRPYREDERMVYIANVDKMKNMLGWEMPTSIASGLNEMISYYCELKGENKHNTAQAAGR